MRACWLWMAWGVVACRSVEPAGRHRPVLPSTGGTLSTTGLPTGSPTGTTPTTGATSSTWSTTFDCTQRPQPPFDQAQFAISTEEDFSFDMDGHLVYQSGSSILGADATGAFGVLATGAPGDPAGLDVVSVDTLLIAGPDTGTLREMDLVGGGGDTLLSGLNTPNSVLGGNDGLYYVAQAWSGVVNWYDPVTGDTGVVASGLPYANGMALSPDEQIMYIGGSETISTVSRDPVSGAWDPSTLTPFFTGPGGLYYALDVDVCGWIYTVDYLGGDVFRISPDGSTFEPIAQLTGWTWGGMNFGNDAGDWERDRLYLTDRSKVIGIRIGVPGAPGPNLVLP